MIRLSVIWSYLRLVMILVKVESPKEEMSILSLGFLLVCLHNVRALLLQVLSVFAFVRFVLGSRFGKIVAD